MSTSYAIASSLDRRLAPFKLPKGLLVADVCAKRISSWKDLYGVLTRHCQEKSAQVMDATNRRRQLRVFDQGETVFRRLPMPARLPKRIFPEPGAGPYQVASQPTTTSVTPKGKSRRRCGRVKEQVSGRDGDRWQEEHTWRT